MNVHVKVDLEQDGPVVVKSAAGPAADRLRRERTRLARAVHPGVVALATAPGTVPHDVERDRDGGDPGRPDASGDEGSGPRDGDGPAELRTCYAGEPAARWSGPMAAVAGLGAAVASTLADLHDMGIVHGRLDGSHVLIADDGRPRLCGLAGTEGAIPSDDVAALGALLGELLSRCSDRPRGALPWRRTPRTARRPLEQVVEQATDPVATRRPTARALADAILTAVPTASLPDRAVRPHGRARRDDRPRSRRGEPGGHAVPSSPGASPGDGTASSPDMLDLIWSYADLPSDDERWAEALGSGPPDLPLATGRSRQPAAGDESLLPPAEGERPRRSGGDGGDPWTAASGGAGRWGDLDPADTWDATGDGGDEGESGLASTGCDDDHGPSTARTDASDGEPSHRPEPVAVDADLTRDQVAAAGRVAAFARPGAVREHDDAPRHRRLRLTAAGVVAAGLAAAGAVTLGSGGGAGAPRPGPAADPAAAGSDCPPAASPAADVDGDGCPEVLSVQDGMVDAGVARWSLGDPGDHIALGDWDCDGEASAVLLRPATGDVFVFSGWAETGEPVTVDASDRVDGAVGIRAEPAAPGCDSLVVDVAGGGAATVEVAP